MQAEDFTIVVGLHGASDEEYINRLYAAGAREFFVGYVPEWWKDKYGFEVSPNRRYKAGNQVGSLNRLKQIVEAVGRLGSSISVTFNEHYYSDEMLEDGVRLLREVREAGIDSVIVADLSVVELVRQLGFRKVILSGDAGIYNLEGMRLARELAVDRVILPRELTLYDIQGLGTMQMEKEAFIMGEPCVFDGARCFTEHGYTFSHDFCNFHEKKTLFWLDSKQSEALPGPGLDRLVRHSQTIMLGKCGLCAIPFLREAGVRYLKVPGRASVAVEAVNLVKKAIQLASTQEMQQLLDEPDLCKSRKFCYYPEVWRIQNES